MAQSTPGKNSLPELLCIVTCKVSLSSTVLFSQFRDKFGFNLSNAVPLRSHRQRLICTADIMDSVVQFLPILFAPRIMSQALWTALALAAGSAARFVADSSAQIPLTHASSCENTAVSRQCWGQYNLSTNYYTRFPDTGRTVEVWLSVEEHDCSPDGYERSSCMTVNGTIPGPAIIADWGDDLVIHITNNMKTNGTSIHWHGVRQLHSVEYDGVPGVTQCPIPPGQSMTYKFKVTQYGSSWYHSHFSVQYSEGLFGPLIFNGPATANFDEDLGMLFLQDWSHQPIFNAWVDKEKYQITHPLSTILINGTNSFDCSTLENPAHAAKCSGNGTKFETVFESGKKYRIRLINTATDSQFQFSIDNHMLKVIAIDFVPIEPYDTESIIINSAQRYDIVVEANAQPGDYWLRADWVAACFGVANENPENSRGIVRYNAASKLDPVSESTVAAPKTCGDEPYDKLVPYLKFNVSNITTTTVEDLEYHITNAAVYHWTINSSTFEIDWSQPTLLGILDNVSDFPSTYNIVDIDSLSTDAEWAVLVIQNLPGSFFVK